MREAMLLIAGGGMAAGLSLWQMEAVRYRFHSTMAAARTRWRLGRRTIGVIVGTLLAAGVVLTARTIQLDGLLWLVALVFAGIVWMVCGVVLPRLPRLREERQIKAIRLALPAAIAQWRIDAQGRQTLRVMMERYLAVVRPERAALQAVVAQACASVDAGATRIVTEPRTGQTFREPLLLGDALVQAAQASGCHDLIAVMGILADADRSSGVASAAGPLERQGALLERIIKAELDQMIARRALGLIVCAAPAVIAALILIIFVAAAGGSVEW